jgi:predicted NBD/HSP70 family sugar kinase
MCPGPGGCFATFIGGGREVSADDRVFLGVDLGGTQMRMAAVTAHGQLATDVLVTSTGPAFGPVELRRALRDLGRRLHERLGGREVAALGFGTPGVVGREALSQCDNLPLLNGSDLLELLRGAASCPVKLENDARCFTLAEARFGAGRGAGDVCGITLGTGVGCGVMTGGRLHRGAGQQAGEVWRIPIRGRPLEDFLSGAGVVRGYEAAGGRSAPGLDARALEGRAREGDPAALAAWHAFGEDLAFLCASVTALLDPEVIVIGGSLAQARGLYDAVLDERLARYAVRLATSELGRAAGLIGAAALNID